jgi:O-antigen/teichoic acid export membrane protein
VTSHRQILRSSAIIGGASVVNIVIAIVKIKVFAVVLGPVGIGLVGLYQNILGVASTLAGCGMSGSGIRQVAASSDDTGSLAIVRRALWLANVALGLAGMVILWLLRESVATWVFGDIAHADEVGWLGIGVLLSLLAGSQTALLQGLRRIGDLARISVISASCSAIVGVALVYQLGQAGVVWFVVAASAISVLVATYYSARLPRTQAASDWGAIGQHWKAMLKLGMPFMGASVLTLGTELAARSIILRELGLDASGHFQAAWAISMTYMGFVLAAMAADYYPRLSEAINDPLRARRLVNEQAEMALLLAGPVLLAMITLSPWIIQLLYADAFAPAGDLLRWQILGDILKVACWPMGFILLAMGRGGVFIATELAWNGAYLGAIAFGTQEWGLMVAGVGFAFAYSIYLLVLVSVTGKLIGYRPDRRNVIFMGVLLIAGGLTVYVAKESTAVRLSVGLVTALPIGFWAARRVDHLIDVRSWLRQRLGR